MLKRFEVTNFKGFGERFSLDLSNTKSYEFNENCVSNNIVRFAQCYGPNGSGKSNLGIAILDIATHLTDTFVHKRSYLNYLNASSSLTAAEFKYTFQFGEGEVIYKYSKSDVSTLIKESLWIDGELLIELDRKQSKLPVVRLVGTESLLLDDIRESQISIVKFIAKNSILAKNNINEKFAKFLEFIDHMLYFRSLQDTSFIGFQDVSESILDYFVKNNLVPDFEKFLNDMGLDYKLVEVEDSDSEKSTIGVKFGNKTKRLPEIASTGTKALSVFYYWYKRIEQKDHPSFVFIDEFDAFYHFKVAEAISKMLANMDKHQVILTTHNTGLFSNEISRPDCNFILAENTVSPIYSLTKKELRSAHNIEKIYRAGGFDGN